MLRAFAALASGFLLTGCWESVRPVETRLRFRPATDISEFSCVFANVRTPGFVAKPLGALTQAKVGCLGLGEFSPAVTPSFAVSNGVIVETGLGPNKRVEVLGVKGVSCAGKTVAEVLGASGAQLYELGSATVNVTGPRTVTVKSTYSSDSLDRVDACLSPLRILTPSQKFGVALLGGTTYRPLWVLNQSDAAITISSITSTASQFSVFTGRSCYPTIPVGKVCELSAAFTPSSSSSVSGTVSLNYTYAGDAKSADFAVQGAADNLTGVADNAFGSSNGRMIKPLGSSVTSEAVFDAALDGERNLLIAGQLDAQKSFLRRFSPTGSDDVDSGDFAAQEGTALLTNQFTGIAVDPPGGLLFLAGKITDLFTEGLFAKFTATGELPLLDRYSLTGSVRIDLGSNLEPMEPIVGPSHFFAYLKGITSAAPVRLGRFSRKDGSLLSTTTVTLPSPLAFEPKQTVQSITGKIYTLGRGLYPPASDGEIVIVRFNEDGSLDTGWGSSGFQRIDLDGSNSNDYPRAIAVSYQGSAEQIFVAGGVIRASEYSFVAKLTSSGALDTTFGGGSGRLEIDLAPGYADFAVSVVAQPDGKPLLLSQKINGSFDRTQIVWRLYADGSDLDSAAFNSAAGYGGTAGVFVHPVCVDDAPTRLVYGGATAYIVGVSKVLTGISGCVAAVANLSIVKVN